MKSSKATKAKVTPTRITSARRSARAPVNLDADGVLHVSLPTEVDAQKHDYRYRIEAHVTDASNREIMGGRGVIVTYSTIVVLLQTDRYVYAPGQQAEITVRTLDYDSNPVSTNVQLQFESHESWGADARRRVLSRASVSTDVNGTGHYTYSVPTTPWLTIHATGFDRNRREASFESSLWISGAGFFGETVAYHRVDIYPDKHSYKPGETAHF